MAQKTTPDEAAPAAAPTPQIVAHPAETLDTAIAAARLASPRIVSNDGREHVFVPRGFDLKTLPDETRLSPWPKARITVDNRASLSAYANRFSTDASVLIADYDKAEITAHLDWHADNHHALATGADAHSVTLKLRPSEEFTRWNAFEGKLHPQDEFARFLEENAADVGEPEAATMIELSRDFEASMGQTFKSSVRLDNGDRRMVFESETKAQNGVIVPQRFTLCIPLYLGEDPDHLTALFRWRADGSGKVMLGFQWHRVEYMRQAHFAQIAHTAAEETGLPVFIGRVA